MVLGADQMKACNPILSDFLKMSLTFQKDGQEIVLKGIIGNQGLNLKWLSQSKQRRLCTRMSMDWWLNCLLSMGRNRSLRRFSLWCMICHWNSMQSSLNLLSYHQGGSLITGFHWKKALNQSILDHIDIPMANTWRFCELYSDEWFSKIDL